jgi:nucleotide-binding universal stress UspA family protein
VTHVSGNAAPIDEVPFRTIVAGVDGSEPSTLAVATATRLARGLHSALVLTYVVDTPRLMRPPGLDLGSWSRQEMVVGRELLERTAASLPPGLDVHSAVRVGDAADELLAEADAQPDPLVVVGCRGRGSVRAAIMGSTSRRLLARSAHPVAVVHAEEPGGSSRLDAPLRNVLVPLDGSPESLSGLRLAAWVAAGFGASLTLLHVEIVGWALAPVDPAALDNVLRDVARVNRQVLLAAAASVSALAPASTIASWSTSVTGRILEAARSGEHDLVVIGSHGRGRDHRSLMGSVAAGVALRSPVPVLVVFSEGAMAHEPQREAALLAGISG